jgi:predicted N-acetyltransferase YhbS
VIKDAEGEHLEAIVALADQRRGNYEQAQPQFWRQAENAIESHRPFVQQLIESPDVISLVELDADGQVLGYVFATLVAAPPVYKPGGHTGFIDDFAVVSDDLWPTTGRRLLAEASAQLHDSGASQVVVVAGHHDEPKRATLTGAGLTIASEWWFRSF